MRFPAINEIFKSRLPGMTKLPDASALVQRLMAFNNPLPATAVPAEPPAPAGTGHFVSSMFRNEAGSRPYKLYIPSGYQGQALPLVVMLHGCTQSPDDFAVGTRMNEAAEPATCLVAYPAQTSQANMQRCWNWFNEADQKRGHGEAGLIAGITREIMDTYAVDPDRVYVAGLSAGGAQAAIMADAYPELYAAVCIHSGLACGAASDMSSAMMVMRTGGRVPRSTTGTLVPTIVFHGESDTTVHPSNADEIIANLAVSGLRTKVERGTAPGGHGYSRTISTDRTGAVVAEQWRIQGGSHGWSGGSSAGSYTDPAGPDATREMLRFFWEHPKGK